MAIQFPNFTGAGDTAPSMPDYQKAIASGLANYIQANKARFAPENEKALSMVNQAKGKYADQRELAGLNSTLASTEHTKAGTHGLNITNRELGDRLHQSLIASRNKNTSDAYKSDIKKRYPFLGVNNAAGQIDMIRFLNDHPEYNNPINQNSDMKNDNGLVQEGNIDLDNRPIVNNPETGGQSTVYSMSIGTPKGEMLIPRVSDDGKVLSEQDAINQFHKTGKHLGIYNSQQNATNAAQSLHSKQQEQYPPESSIPGYKESYIPNIAQQLSDKFSQLPEKQQTATRYSDLLKQALMKEQKNKKALTVEEKTYNRYQDVLQNPKSSVDDIQHAKSAWDASAYGRAKQIDNSLKDYREKRLNQAMWTTLPPESKKHIIAEGQGAGIPSDVTAHWMLQGHNFDDLLLNYGYDKNNRPEPIYELTGGNISKMNEREYASREVKYLSDVVQKYTGEYASTIKGYSPDQIMDNLSGKNKEQQAKFLAARGLSSELVNLRLVLGNVRPTVHALKNMEEKAMLKLKALNLRVDSDVWNRAQSLMDQELQNAFAASKKGYGQVKLPTQNTNNAQPFSFSDYPVVGE